MRNNIFKTSNLQPKRSYLIKPKWFRSNDMLILFGILQIQNEKYALGILLYNLQILTM
jgi:hypothetical protein